MDPLAETSRRWSTYTYAYNNPIRFIDPDGRTGQDWIRKDGTWAYDANITTEEQARKIAGIDGFAKNGTVVQYGEGGYARLNDGNSVDWLPNDTAQDKVTNAMALFSQFLGGNSDSTWGTDPQEFPQITDTGGMARTDFDASTWDKLRPGDKTFTLDKGSFIQPASLPGGNGFGDTDNAFSEGVKNLLDVIGLFNKKEIDTVYFRDYTFDKDGIKDTLYQTPIKKGETWESAYNRVYKMADSIRTSKY